MTDRCADSDRAGRSVADVHRPRRDEIQFGVRQAENSGRVGCSEIDLIAACELAQCDRICPRIDGGPNRHRVGYERDIATRHNASRRRDLLASDIDRSCDTHRRAESHRGVRAGSRCARDRQIANRVTDTHQRHISGREDSAGRGVDCEILPRHAATDRAAAKRHRTSRRVVARLGINRDAAGSRHDRVARKRQRAAIRLHVAAEIDRRTGDVEIGEGRRLTNRRAKRDRPRSGGQRQVPRAIYGTGDVDVPIGPGRVIGQQSHVSRQIGIPRQRDRTRVGDSQCTEARPEVDRLGDQDNVVAIADQGRRDVDGVGATLTVAVVAVDERVIAETAAQDVQPRVTCQRIVTRSAGDVLESGQRYCACASSGRQVHRDVRRVGRIVQRVGASVAEEVACADAVTKNEAVRSGTAVDIQ